MLFENNEATLPFSTSFSCLVAFQKNAGCYVCFLYSLITICKVPQFLFIHFFFSSSFFLLWHFNASDLFQRIMKTSSAFSWFPHFWVLWQRMLVDLVKLENVTLLFILWWMHIHEYSSMQKQLQAVLKRTKTKVTLKWFSPGVVFRVKHGNPILAFKKTSFFVSENN